MAKRLVQHSPYYLQLGAEYLNKTIIPDSEYQMSLRRATIPLERHGFIHMMFEETASRIAVGLLKANASLDTASSCTIRVYKVANDATPWVDTLIKTVSPAISTDKLFKTTIDESETGEEIFGDVIFKIVARIQRGNSVYYVQDYFNHMVLS